MWQVRLQRPDQDTHLLRSRWRLVQEVWGGRAVHMARGRPGLSRDQAKSTDIAIDTKRQHDGEQRVFEVHDGEEWTAQLLRAWRRLVRRLRE